MTSINETRRPGIRRHALAAATAALCAGLCGTAAAVDFDTGNEDLTVRWDNTVRYNLGYRVEGQNPAIIGNINLDDGDRNFARHSIVTNRLDLLSEFDVVYQKKFGARVSAAGWYDQAYAGGFDNTSLATSNHIVNGQKAFGLSPYANRYYHGPSGEWLDAFVFGNFDLASMPATVRVGRHTVNWGEGLLLGGAIHGNTYSQAPLDYGKSASTPGTEAKELFMPLNQLSAQLQATPELSFAAQYYLQWASTRVMEGGTYLGPADQYFLGGEAILQALPNGSVLTVPRAPDVKPKDRGDWGIAARWRPEWLDGTMGFYYRNFTDKLPQVVVGLNGALPGKFNFTYGSDIDLYGLSLSRQFFGVSVGADLNYRKNMVLASDSLAVPATRVIAPGEVVGARGNTWHAVVNAIGTAPVTPLWDSANWSAEFAWNRWDKVTSDPLNRFKGRAGNTSLDAVTKDYYGIAVNFTPTWFQVFPGADLSMPLSYSVGLKGNSAVLLGGNEDAGSYSVGLAMDLYSKYRFDLKYVDFFGTLKPAANGVVPVPGTAVAGANGLTPLVKDRGAVYFTFKTTF
ncbi:DUF1302 domain-containing protein [Ramlibacter solisilvae]|uniref:DUF1302 domain-containing protein n=1 Tax=Ramlibacter tataouinensis TaxID=94132 RepID=A0A127K0L7_9BURK|nr:DUF1302 domain-containing protein [Ramlibacter tataouinensis]AMO24122.1 hypothetical protein UC35_16320 [Ramlibacter tataouinensis]